jgi:hypothetical protein
MSLTLEQSHGWQITSVTGKLPLKHLEIISRTLILYIGQISLCCGLHTYVSDIWHITFATPVDTAYIIQIIPFHLESSLPGRQISTDIRRKQNKFQDAKFVLYFLNNYIQILIGKLENLEGRKYNEGIGKSVNIKTDFKKECKDVVQDNIH